jgi:hypothetical protein
MALFQRRERPPADLVDALGPGERVLSWADTDGGQVVVATPRGLWWPDETADELRLIPWQFIDKATWRDGWLTVLQADVVDDVLLVDRAPVTVKLAQPRDLPPTVRKRVEGNIVRNELLRVDGGAVRFVARKQPGIDGLGWWARLEPGTRDTEPVRAAVRARLETLRAG